MLDRAFATSAGLRSLGEVVEMNVLRASAEADPTSPAAQLAWLRATLAWLAFGPPEAAPAGIVAILLGEGADYVRARLDIDISETIADRMAAAWPRIEAELGGEYPAVLVMTEAVRPKRVLGGSGASIGWMESSDAAPTYVRPRVRLVRLVEAALATLCPALADLDRGVFLVDTNLGLDIPATRDEALSVALRTKADELVFGTEHVPLDAGARARIANGLVVRLSDTVVIGDGDDRLSCRFRRHRPEAALAADQAEAIAPLRDNPRMPLATLAVLLGRTLADTERLYRAIEALGILRIVVENSGAPAAEAAPTVEKE